LIVEVTGQFRREKAAKAATAIDLWVPAVNNQGRMGRWSFLEVTDPWDAANLLRAHAAALRRGLVSTDSAAIIAT
jgi:type III restriction enzyme